jgi:hypothetical protein
VEPYRHHALDRARKDELNANIHVPTDAIIAEIARLALSSCVWSAQEAMARPGLSRVTLAGPPGSGVTARAELRCDVEFMPAERGVIPKFRGLAKRATHLVVDKSVVCRAVVGMPVRSPAIR